MTKLSIHLHSILQVPRDYTKQSNKSLLRVFARPPVHDLQCDSLPNSKELCCASQNKA